MQTKEKRIYNRVFSFFPQKPSFFFLRKYNCYVSHQLKNNKNTEGTITSVDFVLNKRHVRFLHTVEGADVMIDDRDLLTLTTGTVTQRLYSRS